MEARHSRSLAALVLCCSVPLAGQEATKLRPLAEILGAHQETRELEARLAGDHLYFARRCVPLMIMLGTFLAEEEGQEQLARTFTELGEEAIAVVDRLEAARPEQPDRPPVQDVRVLTEAIGYQYVDRLRQNKENRGHYYEGDPWLEGDVAFCAEWIPILRGGRHPPTATSNPAAWPPPGRRGLRFGRG